MTELKINSASRDGTRPIRLPPVKSRRQSPGGEVAVRLLLDEVEAVARIGSYSVDLRTGVWVSSTGLDEIFGIDARFVRTIGGWASLIHPDDRDAVVAYLADDVVANKRRFDRQYRVLRADTGAERWIHGRGALKFDSDGGPIALSGTIADVTEERAAEEELFAARERAQVTLNSIGDAVICTDVLGRITYLNLAAEGMTGWMLDEASGRPISDVVVILDARNHRHIASQTDLALRLDATVHVPPNSILIHRDGREIPIADTVSPIHDLLGRVTGAVKVFRDVTAARTVELHQQAVDAELERSNLELMDFATIASHDLQEPLRKIQAFGERLEETSAGVLDADSQDYLQRMTGAAGRMQSLVSDLLEFSQVAVGPAHWQRVDLATVVSEVLVDLDQRIRTSHGEISVGPLPTIMGNPIQLRRLFQNLIANALKFHADGISPTVDVDASPREIAAIDGRRAGPREAWDIRVRDNGIGFDARHGEKIFAPFQRLNGRQAYEGTGMGLAICRRIAVLHGGTVTATASLGVGATFVVTLPRLADPDEAVA